MRTHCLAITAFAAALAVATAARHIKGAHCAAAGQRCSITYYYGCCDSSLSCTKKSSLAGGGENGGTYCLKPASVSKATLSETMAPLPSTITRPPITTSDAAPTTAPSEPSGTLAATTTMLASTGGKSVRATTSLETTGTKLAAAKQPSASKNAGGDTFIQQILDVHNKYRAEVGSPALTWSATVASDALQWANHLSSSPTLSLVHSGANGQGENLWGGLSNYFSYTQMVQSWADEKADFTGPTFNSINSAGGKQIGHYTQMVWKTTTQIGCAVGTGNGNDYLVCRYTPPGNVIGENVY